MDTDPVQQAPSLIHTAPARGSFLSRHNAYMEDLIPVFLEQRDIEDLYAHLRRHYGPLDSGTVSRICYALEMTFDDTSKADM